MPAYDALLLIAFGGPEQTADVIPFLENVLRGRNVPRERMLEVAEHYYHFGGFSPINGQMRELTMSWAEQHEVQPFVAQPPHRSPTVSCLQASGRDVEAMAKRALAAGFKIDKGYGDMKGKTFRIGHMGDHTPARLQRLLAALV